MMRRNELATMEKIDMSCSESDSLTINVFTSSSCAFCNDALTTVKEAANKLRQFEFDVEVVETSVEEKPEIIEAFNVIALPLILVGNSQIVGLPRSEDIELLLHKKLLK